LLEPSAVSESPAVVAIVLAAGEGTRMKSTLPKPLHPVSGRAMVLRVIDSLDLLNVASTVVVIGHGADQVRETVVAGAPATSHVQFAEQTERRGTGHATVIGLAPVDTEILAHSTVVVMPGDTPLLTAETIAALVKAHLAAGNAATLLTSHIEDPAGYGRVIRANDPEKFASEGEDASVFGIVEHKDATPEQLQITEINTGIYAFNGASLAPALNRIGTNNSQGEYYLTDVIGILRKDGHRIGAISADASETAGVNDPIQLADAERIFNARHR